MANFPTKFHGTGALNVKWDMGTVSTLSNVYFFSPYSFIYGLFYVVNSPACQYLSAPDKRGWENI